MKDSKSDRHLLSRLSRLFRTHKSSHDLTLSHHDTLTNPNTYHAHIKTNGYHHTSHSNGLHSGLKNGDLSSSNKNLSLISDETDNDRNNNHTHTSFDSQYRSDKSHKSDKSFKQNGFYVAGGKAISKSSLDLKSSDIRPQKDEMPESLVAKRSGQRSKFVKNDLTNLKSFKKFTKDDSNHVENASIKKYILGIDDELDDVPLGAVNIIKLEVRNGVEVKSVQASVGRKSVTGMKEISYTNESMIGNGSFGVVYKATLVEENEVVAIKRVLQDRRFKNRELSIMVSLEHCNIVRLKYYFYTYKNQPKDDIYLNLVLEFIPDTVSKVGRHYMRQGQKMPLLYIKLYMYQLFRSLAYIHHLGICHRDIKPQNLLVNPMTGVLKLCDFGSAKHLVLGEMNVSYICSRYYRAPELIFGATNYTTKIDIWSAGCVFAELWLGFPIFSGESGVDQLVEIIKVLGTPTREQILRMNRHYTEFKFPKINANPWDRVLGSRTPTEVIDLISRLLDYTPIKRLEPLKACTHPFFDELRNPNSKLPNDRELPPLFNFTPQELKVSPKINRRLIPEHLHGQYSQYLQHSQKSADSSSGEGGDPAHDLDHNPSAGTTTTTSPAPTASTANTNPSGGVGQAKSSQSSGHSQGPASSTQEPGKQHANSSSSNNNNSAQGPGQVGSTTGGGMSGNGSSGPVAHLATDPENSSVSTTSMHSVDAPSTESASSIEPVATTN